MQPPPTQYWQGREEELAEISGWLGDRLGEANTLQGLGSSQESPAEAMTYFQEAQTIFKAIGDKYSQGRNLLMFIVNAQAQLDDVEGVMRSLDEAEAIGQEINVEILCEVAAQIRAEVLSQADRKEE